MTPSPPPSIPSAQPEPDIAKTEDNAKPLTPTPAPEDAPPASIESPVPTPADVDQLIEPPSLALKREYLSLLDKDRLVDLLLAYDDDPIHAPAIFPDADLQEAVDSLRAGGSQDGRAKLDASEMPSYEDMIAQAIAEIADPDGTMPKVLFQWMDQNYPLQTNFRPSASQALQRAYKRGRLDKLPTGRYILNPGWDGAPSSKRATRRPKTIKPEPPVTTFRNGSGGSPMPTRASTGAAAGPSSGRPQRAAAQKGRQQIQDTIMRDESPPASAARPARASAATAVKSEDADQDAGPDTRESVHAMLVTLAKQLAALQAERRKLKKPR